MTGYPDLAESVKARDPSSPILLSRTPIKLEMSANLISLREQVLARSTKRMPKWKFRLAPDVVTMIQPKVAYKHRIWVGSYPDSKPFDLMVHFEGTVLMCDGANAELLAKPGDAADGYNLKDFLIGKDEAGDWYIAGDGGKRGYAKEWTALSMSERTKIMEASDLKVSVTLFSSLNDGRFETINASVMLSCQCLICGKKLTDPASMARFIGPECAGTSSLHVPRMQNLSGNGSAFEAAPAPKRQRKPKAAPQPELFADDDVAKPVLRSEAMAIHIAACSIAAHIEALREGVGDECITSALELAVSMLVAEQNIHSFIDEVSNWRGVADELRDDPALQHAICDARLQLSVENGEKVTYLPT